MTKLTGIKRMQEYAKRMEEVMARRYVDPMEVLKIERDYGDNTIDKQIEIKNKIREISERRNFLADKYAY